MENYKIKTEKFEGPLDLLMHLIEKDKLDIYDIPIASVTQQYLSYIDSMQNFDIEIASEFLLMAAILLQIKSRMLLPKQLNSENEEDEYTEEDPRQSLVDRLTTYRQFKILGKMFDEMWDKQNFIITREPALLDNIELLPSNLSIEQLLLAIAELLDDDEQIQTYIQADEFNVQDKINDILNLLKLKNGQIVLNETLIRAGSTSELISSFLAILELLKLGKVNILQPERYGTIYIYAKEE